MDVPDLADPAVRDERASFLALRVEADVEVRAVDESAALGELEQLGRLHRVQRERLLADDVLARLEDRLHLRVVQVVGRRQVHDLDALVRQHRLEALVRGGKRD